MKFYKYILFSSIFILYSFVNLQKNDSRISDVPNETSTDTIVVMRYLDLNLETYKTLDKDTFLQYQWSSGSGNKRNLTSDEIEKLSFFINQTLKKGVKDDHIDVRVRFRYINHISYENIYLDAYRMQMGDSIYKISDDFQDFLVNITN